MFPNGIQGFTKGFVSTIQRFPWIDIKGFWSLNSFYLVHNSFPVLNFVQVICLLVEFCKLLLKMHRLISVQLPVYMSLLTNSVNIYTQ